MKQLLVVWCLFLFYSTTTAERVKRQGFPGNRCYTPDNLIGLCVPLPNCPSLLQLYANNGGSRDVVSFLKMAQRSCGNRISRNEPVICCSRPVQTTIQQPPQNDQNFSVNPNNPFLNGQNGGRPGSLPQIQDPTTPQLPPETPPPTPPPTSPPTPPPTQPPPPSTSALTTASQRPAQNRANDCFGPDARQGSCRSLVECPELLMRLQANPADQSFAQFLRLSNQICNAKTPIICCPDGRSVSTGPVLPTPLPTIKPRDTDVPRLLTPEEGCGQSGVSHRKIVGGHPSQLASWPWLALLGYEGANGIAFRCGGSLVTKRHIVTAAHCIINSLRTVRLGEHDLDTNSETPHVDVNVVRSIRHPQYSRSSGRNDIAVLVLAQDVKFTDTIGPICVPDKIAFASRNLVGFTPFIAGWGRTKEDGPSASILQEAQIPILRNQECMERYRAQNALQAENQFDEATLCAGELAGGKDSCQGDSGGPLMLPDRLNSGIFFYNMLGVVSYGIGCARAGIPGVYANVPYFSDWIKQQISQNLS